MFVSASCISICLYNAAPSSHIAKIVLRSHFRNNFVSECDIARVQG